MGRKRFHLTPNSNLETLCVAQKDHKSHVETSRGDKSSRGRGRINYRGRGGKNNQRDIQQNDRKQRNFNDRPAIKCYRCGKIGHTATDCKIPWEKVSERREQLNEKKYQPPLDKGKSSESTHYIVAHYIFNINDVFNTAFSS